ncbi:Thiol-disulfide isomerase or thioredoxin [Paenibacillus algorifonticola]|uniref:Thiol-disulfide isomerase or thioredoxin n=1 Tax=Paenibacillus algorifonticola TaxID=684063 RepID=A0A1I2IJ39_9BACL|nr:TlpA disulfide reductase family protein [Paenibacillus algorifonticola]SFF42359.1 Thiol-disulfide isomerase or thioredoxin [Paenibacillus algorifonticola]
MDAAVAHSPKWEWEDEVNWLNCSYRSDESEGDKKLFVYLWSISCGYCKEIIPDILQMHQDNASLFQLVSIHVPISDSDLDREKVHEVVGKLGINGPVLLDNEHRWISLYESEVLPSFYLYDAQGKLVSSKVGIGNIKSYLSSLIHE